VISLKGELLMITKELLEYIKEQKKSGVPDVAIRASLVAIGWNDADISEGFINVSGNAPSAPHEVVEQKNTVEGSGGKVNIIDQKYLSIGTDHPEVARINHVPLRMIALAAAVLVLGAAAVFAQKTFIKEDPLVEIARAFKNLSAQDSYASDASFTLALGRNQISLSAKGHAQNISNPSAIQYEGLMKADVLVAPSQGFDIRIDTEAEVKVIAGVVYAKFIKPLSPLLFPELANIGGKWLFATMPSGQSVSMLQTEEVKDVNEKRIQEILTSQGVRLHDFFIVESLGKQIIDSEKFTAYKVRFNTETVLNFITALDFSAPDFNNGADLPHGADIYIDPAKKTIISILGALDIRVWIDEKNDTPKKLALKAEVELPSFFVETLRNEFGLDQETKNLNLVFDVVYKDFGKKISITPPMGAVSFEEILNASTASSTLQLDESLSPQAFAQ